MAGGAKARAGRSAEVDAFLNERKHPLGAEVQGLRLAILGANPRIVERVKWNAPSFGFDDDRVTFNLRSDDHLMLVFHTGAKPKRSAKRPQVADPSGLIKWLDPGRGVVKLTPAEAKAKRADVARLAAAWILATS